MMVDQQVQDAALHWLPTPEAPTRELQPPVDGMSAMVDWLAAQGFDGAMVVQSGAYELVLLVLGGGLIGASLRSSVGGQVIAGPPALTGFIDRVGQGARTQASLLPFPRPLVECLASSLDPHPNVQQLEGTDQLRDALREVAASRHHGVVDLIVGERWGRTLFHNGRLLGAYHYDSRAVAPSLAALGRLAATGPATLVTRTAAASTFTPIRWPTIGPAAMADPSSVMRLPAGGSPRNVVLPNPARDERIENNLLWLLSHVDKDRERAVQAQNPEPRVLQVLASFSNAVFAFAAHLVPSSRRGLEAPRYTDAIAMLRPRHPLLAELELRKDELDASALARRCRGLPREGTYAGDFYRGMVRGLLALTGYAAGLILQEIGDAEVLARCAASLEAWVDSVESMLRGPQAPA